MQWNTLVSVPMISAENASMYVADWLRAFAALPLASVLLDDRPIDGSVALDVPLEAYSPVLNVTDHYGWTLGLRREGGVQLAGAAGRVESGVVIPAGFWLERAVAAAGTAAEPQLGDFLVAEIPPNAVPEHVLARLATLA